MSRATSYQAASPHPNPQRPAHLSWQRPARRVFGSLAEGRFHQGVPGRVVGQGRSTRTEILLRKRIARRGGQDLHRRGGEVRSNARSQARCRGSRVRRFPCGLRGASLVQALCGVRHRGRAGCVQRREIREDGRRLQDACADFDSATSVAETPVAKELTPASRKKYQATRTAFLLPKAACRPRTMGRPTPQPMITHKRSCHKSGGWLAAATSSADQPEASPIDVAIARSPRKMVIAKLKARSHELRGDFQRPLPRSALFDPLRPLRAAARAAPSMAPTGKAA